MRCLLIDDEAPARHELRQLLSVHLDVEIVGEAANVADALALAARHRPDLVLLDIQLRGESGFDFVAALPDDHPHRIVFVTAYDEHAVRAFECNALDYLLKPVLPARLAATLRRAQPARLLPARADDSVFVKDGSLARFVRWTEIVHIESEGNYTRVHLDDASAPLMLRPLKEWLDLSPPALFVQIHRTLLVRRSAIHGIRQVSEDRRLLVLANHRELPIGRSYWPAVRALLLR